VCLAEYDVYVGERATPFIAYAAPEIDAAKATLEPRQIDRVDAPRALCGATVLTSDLLMTSVRCSPRYTDNMRCTFHFY
jgi:hypothetical protein